MQKVQKVCSGEIKPKPKRVTYLPYIEECIEVLDTKITRLLTENNKGMARWVSIKLIDGDEKILNSIEDNLKIKLINNNKLKREKETIGDILANNGVQREAVKSKLTSSIIFMSENVASDVVTRKEVQNKRERKIDKVLTSRVWGIPIMLAFLGLIFWITISGANYISDWLTMLFGWLQGKLVVALESVSAPAWLMGALVDGVYRTLTWIIAVMLPPMAIFFPLFTLLEDLGFLPRISFNLDKFFRKAGTSGKQALTMCMGFGCNSAGVTGCRIIDSPREKLIAILTNAFVPCNGRFPLLIIIATIFFGGLFAGKNVEIVSTIAVLAVVILGICMTLFVSKILSKTILKGESGSFILELPPYRKPQIGQVIVRSIFDRTLFVLGRAILVAAPAGLVIWLFANINIGDMSILNYIANFFDPFARLMGLDGYILTAFILGIPANEIVLPIALMCYMGSGSLVDLEETATIGQILVQNGWTVLTAINVMIFTLLHFPCTTTLLTIKKETGSLKWSAIAFILPTICGVVLCLITTGVWNLMVGS